jgi:SNF2 family DNA or RNA helicase
MELFNYQKKAIDFMAESKKTYLAMDMGTGKTLTSLAYADQVAKKNVLLIAEKNEIVNSQNFSKEVVKYFPDFQYISLRETELSFLRGSNTRTVCGINPEGLAKHDLRDIKELFDVVIIDEATLAKTTTSQRFKKVLKIVKEIDYLVLLSGTPMMNGASEIYAPLLLLDHPLVAGKKAKGKKAFETVFAGGHYRKIKNTGKWFLDNVWWAKGANNVRELRFLLKDNFFFMQKGDTDVFKKRVRTVKIVPMGMEWLSEYLHAWQMYLIDAKKRDVNMDNVKELRNLIENGQCYQINSRWKAKQVVQDILEGVYGDKRIVVFSLFIETDRLIQEALGEAGISFRTFEEQEEWKAGTEQVIVGRIKANSKGANLPEASVCLFVDMDFVPSNNIQAENRIDRPEQENEMLVVYYLTEGKDVVDTHVRKINQSKSQKINKFMQPLTPEEIEEMPSRLEALRNRYPKETEILGI